MDSCYKEFARIPARVDSRTLVKSSPTHWCKSFHVFCMTFGFEKLLLQYWRVWGFSLLWNFSCIVLWPGFEKLLLQYWHWYGLSWYESFHPLFYDLALRNPCYSIDIGLVSPRYESFHPLFLLGMNMNNFMHSMTWLWETLATIWTLVWFLLGMNPFIYLRHLDLRNSCYNIDIGMVYPWYESFHVLFYNTWLWETLAIVLTLVWFFLGMNHFIHRSMTWLWQTLATILTLVWFLLFLYRYESFHV